MAAHCEACGGRVMTYRRYAFWAKPTARCGECGSDVRLRHFWTVVGMSLVLVVPIVGVLLIGPSIVGAVAAATAVTASVLALDYASYHVLTWEIDPSFEGDDDVPLLAPPEG